MNIAEFNALPEARAREELTRCCGASRWVDLMVKCRPFKDKAVLLKDADSSWSVMQNRDWMEAFEHHPRIGDKDALREKFKSTATWAEGEQAGAAAADELTLEALAQRNQEYEEKFGFIFIVCATGKSAREMLALLNARLPNLQEAELKLAAEEQKKITKLRLEKLIP